MNVVAVNSFEEWRLSARQLLATATPPPDVNFVEHGPQQSLFAASSPSTSSSSTVVASDARVPKRFIEVARRVACHRDRGRFELLYCVLWRLTHDEPHLLDVETDDDVYQLMQMDKAVRRDAHKAKAFVRFRRTVENGREQFVAWHRPDHRILQLVAPFFARRFPNMEWSILTPDQSVYWDQEQLIYGEGVPASEAPTADELEQIWKTYYASIFNPARVKVRAMVREMPVRHWPTLPETVLIPELLADARRRSHEMIDRGSEPYRSAAQFVPVERTIEQLREHASRCQGCELYCHATQTVFGEGPISARLMLVGEQPGDVEDQVGRPFVGPAGQLLDEAMELAGLQRSEIYLTNAVKHFKFVLRGKRRIHCKPSIQETIACRPWLLAELDVVQPQVLIALGATAAQAIFGTDFRITRQRGVFSSTRCCDTTIATYHPSAVLRAPNPARRKELWTHLVQDLTAVAQLLDSRPHGGAT